jgi:hypothetical protein
MLLNYNRINTLDTCQLFLRIILKELECLLRCFFIVLSKVNFADSYGFVNDRLRYCRRQDDPKKRNGLWVYKNWLENYNKT